MPHLPDVPVFEPFGEGVHDEGWAGGRVLPDAAGTLDPGEGQGASLDPDGVDGWIDYADARARFLSAKIALDNRFAEAPDYATAPFRYQAELVRSGAEAAQRLSPQLRGAFEDSAVHDTARGVAALQDLARDRAQAQGAAWTDGLVENAIRDLRLAPDEHTRAAILKTVDVGLSAAKRRGLKSAEEILALRRQATDGYAESRLSILPEDEQIAALDRATTVGDDGTVLRAKTGTFVDFIPDTRIAALRTEAQERKIVNDRAAAIDAARQQAQARRALEEESRAAEDATIKDLLGPTSTIPAGDIVRNGKLLPATKLHMLALAERVTQPDPRAQVSHATALRLLADIRRQDGDPQRFVDAGPIYDAYTSGQLNRADFEWTRRELADAATPDGAMLARFKARLVDRLRPTIPDVDPGFDMPLDPNVDVDPGFGIEPDPNIDVDPGFGPPGGLRYTDPGNDRLKAEDELYQFQWLIDRKINAYREAGKDPFDLFDPSNPDYLGKPDSFAAFQVATNDSTDHAGDVTKSEMQPAARSLEEFLFDNKATAESIASADELIGVDGRPISEQLGSIEERIENKIPLLAGEQYASDEDSNRSGNAAAAMRAKGISPDKIKEFEIFQELLETRRAEILRVATARDVNQILRPAGTPIGMPGNQSNIRVLPSGSDPQTTAEKLFKDLTKGGEIIAHATYDGTMVKMPGGGIISVRAESKTGGWTIDVDIPGVTIKKIHFK